jgi:hypothetical protein
MGVLTIDMPALHPGQREVRDSPARFKVLACGRRWGKTRLGAFLSVAYALQGKRVWWIAPIYSTSSIGWRIIRRIAQQIPGCKVSLGERLIVFPGGGWVQVKSGHNPEDLRGEGLDLVILDECSFMAEDVWTEALRPALSDRKGHGLFISTPTGRNWFYKLWLRGQDPAHPNWASWQLPSIGNTMIPDFAEEVEEARADLPDETFRQEFLAEFMAYMGLIYHEFNRAAHTFVVDSDRQFPRYVAGVDWGYAAPGSILVYGVDSDSRMWQVDEHYERGIRVEEWATLAKQYQDAYNIETFYCDPSEPDNIDKFNAAGVYAEGAINDVLPGIQAVKNRLVVRGDGLPRLLVGTNCIHTLAEYEQYQWMAGHDGLRDKPKKVNDHAMDPTRYVSMALADDGMAFGSVTVGSNPRQIG